MNKFEQEEKHQLKDEHDPSEENIVDDSKCNDEESKPSLMGFVESIPGIVYIIIGLSIAVVILLGQSGTFITMEDIIENSLIASIGKFVLIVISGALIIYGFKNLRILK